MARFVIAAVVDTLSLTCMLIMTAKKTYFTFDALILYYNLFPTIHFLYSPFLTFQFFNTNTSRIHKYKHNRRQKSLFLLSDKVHCLRHVPLYRFRYKFPHGCFHCSRKSDLPVSDPQWESELAVCSLLPHHAVPRWFSEYGSRNGA